METLNSLSDCRCLIDLVISDCRSSIDLQPLKF